jgi:hypothetical protein
VKFAVGYYMYIHHVEMHAIGPNVFALPIERGSLPHRQVISRLHRLRGVVISKLVLHMYNYSLKSIDINVADPSFYYSTVASSNIINGSCLDTAIRYPAPFQTSLVKVSIYPDPSFMNSAITKLLIADVYWQSLLILQHFCSP